MVDVAERPVSLSVTLHHKLGGFALDATFTAPSPAHGGVTALFGPSGAGKSTIVAAVAGLSRPARGRIVLGEHVLLDTDAGICLPPQQRRAGLVFQDARLFPHMTVRNNLLFGWRRAAVKASDAEIARIVTLLGLEHLLARAPANLSGGEKARVALGRALLSSPDILLLDEPLASLDGARRAEILPYLERLRDAARVPMLYVSHNIDEVARLADHVVLLHEGRVTAEGPAADILVGLDNLGAVIDAMVAGLRADGLTELVFDGGTLAVNATGAPGTRMRFRIAAADILIARAEPRDISANNVLPVTVVEVRVSGELADVVLAAGPTRLMARITAASAQRLALGPGIATFAVIKSVTVDLPARAAP